MTDPKNKVVLFNPRSTDRNHRLPISILQIGASVYGKFDFVFVDGNLEKDPFSKLCRYFDTGEFKFFAITVMPGPQLKQAVPFSKALKEKYPDIITIWGGYFPSNQTEVCMKSGYVDYVIRGPGDIAFPELLNYLSHGKENSPNKINNLAFKDPEGKVIINEMAPIPEQDLLPALPMEHLERFYSLEKYIVKTFIGSRSILYNSSLGCPHNCSFCGVAALYNSAWKGKSARKMFTEIIDYKNRYNIDSLEICDSDFFVSKSLILEFCKLMKGQGIDWWAEGRIDVLNKYSDNELLLIKESGCRLIFMGGESGNDALLRFYKGGTLTSGITEKIVTRFGKAGIIPQLSFILGIPSSDPEATDRQVREDIRFIRKLRKLNPHLEFVLYTYSPVPAHNSELFKLALQKGFSFPHSLDEWLQPEWENFHLRRGRITPWLLSRTVRYIRNFEAILISLSPGLSNFHINKAEKSILKLAAGIRYRLKLYSYPLELRILLKLFDYQRPEKEGFYSE